MEFVTTNIRLPRKTLQDLKLRAARENKSMAELIRGALEKVYGVPTKTRSKDIRKDPFFKLIGMGASGIRDGSVHHDRDIYEIDD